ncbi:unnamed protein product [Vitrella brassicaformis CCMP3155]|uniref:Nuclear migration protein nudC n=1 Tax=Vitrella brassicaformis (strain CCMP3155) TaxID=1169540 RepID=A0A0G4EDU6_VITBC|nr:unnamed protein product [Vitrella brassicaformis CCMP3155]|eukprot:CEL93907.1 unnamed protein product [Vitrella brassicaformis CCMP3155]
MSSVEGEERFDSFFMKVAEEARGIDNLMDYFFSFLERKTDFFTGVQDSKMAEQTVMKAFHKHQKRAIKRREDEKRRHAAEDEERRKKLAAQREKDKAEYEKLQAERRKQQEDLSKRPKIEEITEEEDHQQDHPMKDRQPTTNGAHAAAGKDQPSSSSSASQAANGTTEDKEIKDKAEEVVIGEDDDEADDGAPNPAKYGNGGKTDRYTWTQTLGTVEVLIPVPPGTKSSQLSVVMTADRLKVGLKGQTPIVDGKLHQKIKPDDCMWTLVDNKLVQINIDKYDAMRWWSCVLVREQMRDS